MQFPDDATLIARGKYSTLSRERRKQIERIQTTAGTVMSMCSQILKGVQQETPDLSTVGGIRKCVDNIEAAANAISELSAEMSTLKPDAWE